MTLQERIDRLTEWMGWALGPFEHWYDEEGWNPFESHDDAFLLLLECERRGLMDKVMWALRTILGQSPQRFVSTAECVLATPTQITEAVYAVALPEEKP